MVYNFMGEFLNQRVLLAVLIGEELVLLMLCHVGLDLLALMNHVVRCLLHGAV